MLTEYTTYDDIRAALGVAPEEITDEVLALTSYEQILTFDLYALTPAIGPYYLALSGTLSADQERFKDLMQVYATYVIAQHLLTSLPMFGPQNIKDAKTELQRVSDPYKGTRAGVISFYNLMRARLLAAYLVLVPGAPVAAAPIFNAIASIPLGADPVTGV